MCIFNEAFVGNVKSENKEYLNMFRLNRSQIVAVSIETAFQNGSIAFILIQLTLDDPKNDIATIAPIAQIMLTGEYFIITYGHNIIYVRCTKSI